MSREKPGPDCADIALRIPARLEATAEVALEDYAREVSGAKSADAIHGGEPIVAVHLCGLPAAVSSQAQQDIIDFARELHEKASGGGLGWS